jgi:hypothetical protein
MADVNLLGDYTGGTGMEHIARVMALDHSVHESERDVFMVGIRTFDAHQNPPHMDINMHLTHLNNDLIALHTDLTALNLWESTTIVSISDFARTITSNGACLRTEPVFRFVFFQPFMLERRFVLPRRATRPASWQAANTASFGLGTQHRNRHRPRVGWPQLHPGNFCPQCSSNRHQPSAIHRLIRSL